MALAYTLDLPDSELAALIFHHRGVIFGGYIRDVIAGWEPTDLDVAIAGERAQPLYDALLAYGYRPEDAFSHKWLKANSRDVDVIEVYPEEGEEELLTPEIALDFDVNGLAYDGQRLYMWSRF